MVSPATTDLGLSLVVPDIRSIMSFAALYVPTITANPRLEQDSHEANKLRTHRRSLDSPERMTSANIFDLEDDTDSRLARRCKGLHTAWSISRMSAMYTAVVFDSPASDLAVCHILSDSFSGYGWATHLWSWRKRTVLA